MPVTKHSIVLNITGNAKQAIDALAKKMKATGKDIVSSFKDVGQVSKQVKDAAGAVERAGGALPPTLPEPGAQPGKRRRGAVGGVGVGALGGGLSTAVQVGEEYAAGGTTTGVTGAALTGVGGMMRGMGGKLVGPGMAVAAAGMVSGFIGKMSDQFMAIVDQLTKLAAAGRRYNLGDMLVEAQQTAIKSAVDPNVLRNIATVVARQSGVVSMREAGNIGMMADALGASADTFAEFVALQKRFGTGQGLARNIQFGVASGLKMGNIEEFLQGTMDLQNQLVEVGVKDTGEVQDIMASLGKVSDMLRGRFGAAFAGGMQQRIISAGAGGGGLLSTLLYTSLQRKGLSYYDIRAQAEKGVTGGNLRAIIDLVKSMGGGKQYQAETLANAFGISFNNAQRLLELGELTEDNLKEAQQMAEGQINEYKKSEAFQKRSAQIQRKVTKEGFEEASNAVETAATGLMSVGDVVKAKRMQAAESFIEPGIFQKRRLPWKGAGFFETDAMQELQTKAEWADISFNAEEAYKQALFEANRTDYGRISEEEQREAIDRFTAVVQNIMTRIEQKTGQPLNLNLVINGRAVATGSVNKQAAGR